MATFIYVAVAIGVWSATARADYNLLADTVDASANALYDVQTAYLRNHPYFRGTPNGIYIPRLGIDLEVRPGTYDIPSQTWDLSWDASHYAIQTSLANNRSGLTLIYGHNTQAVFGKTKNLQVGDIVEIRTTEGPTFVYTFISDSVVSPNDTSIFLYDEDKPQLSLLSCTGRWNESRRIMNFSLLTVRQN